MAQIRTWIDLLIMNYDIKNYFSIVNGVYGSDILGRIWGKIWSVFTYWSLTYLFKQEFWAIAIKSDKIGEKLQIWPPILA